MGYDEKKAELLIKRDGLISQLEAIDKAILSMSGENIQRYEVDHGESRHAVERPKMKDLIEARKLYQEELEKVELELSIIEEKNKKSQGKTIRFRFDR